MNPKPKDEAFERFTSALGKTMELAANEIILLNKLEEFFSPKPAKLANNDIEAEEFDKKINYLIEKFEGPPGVIVVATDEEKLKYDTYLGAAIAECLSVFHRSRRSVTRAQMFLIGSHFIEEQPEILHMKKDEDETYQCQKLVRQVFWEHAETSFIRLVSFWDRIGQILDFVFFRIRQYERDGFSAVMDRIRNNFLPVHSNMKTSNAWKALRKYQTSEKEEGFKWLTQRRNMIVHSLHLQPIQDSIETNELFDSAYNHLKEKLRTKLKTGTPLEEMERINAHLDAAAKLFPKVLELCELNLSITKE